MVLGEKCHFRQKNMQRPDIKKGGGGTRIKLVLNWRHLQETFGGNSTTNGGLCINTTNAIQLSYLYNTTVIHKFYDADYEGKPNLMTSYLQRVSGGEMGPY
jgi:hypothetical protein